MALARKEYIRGHDDILETWFLPPPNLPPLFVWRSQRANQFENYEGDRNNPMNRDQDIPESETTSLFVYNLPADCSAKDLLKSIRGFGKIFFVHLNPPKGMWPTVAAKVVFWEHEGARGYLEASQKRQIPIAGRFVRAMWNRIRTRGQPWKDCSRVIRIKGPSEVVSMEFLEPIFKTRFQYVLDEVISEFDNEVDIIELEIRFSSYRAQAATAWQQIRELRAGLTTPEINDIVTARQLELLRSAAISWGKDPCQRSTGGGPA
ncbi:uncharacterized protein F4822DRAFT_431370 [Hypoxylon trugodes]|uniref:uncharacterized protein n=1 Tax=Hypoxylon trugodes TaxID=326681 RepID=UPI00218DD4D5|nr:uncharacterized protein F4822DRAFT_431370 [Hypoxylon trugodes]KAI1386498.1 hypothetical protein F4822DRAFT_431370 [Hypoxylon trugodes]